MVFVLKRNESVAQKEGRVGALGGVSANFLQCVLSRNLDQSMLCVFFEKKTCKNLSVGESAPYPRLPPAAGGSAPRPLRCYTHLLLQLCLVYF